MKIDLKEYILEKRQVLLAVALGLLIYSLVLLLYQIPPEAAGYGILLVFIAEFVWLLSGFGRFRKKQKLLRQLAGERAKDFYLRDLPESEDPKEEAYQDLIESLLKEKNRKEAEAAEKLRDMEEYYTLWGHQIKTPIAAMSLLLQEEDTPENGELSMELFRIEQYVEMVLQYLRLDSPDHDLAFRSVDVDDCVRQAVRKYARSFIRKKIALDFQETGIETVSDEKWLVFVLEQLLSNALKYTKKGTIRIYGGNGFLYRRYGHRHRAGGSAADLREGLHGLQRPPGQEVYGHRPLSLPGNFKAAGPRNHHHLDPGRRHKSDAGSSEEFFLVTVKVLNSYLSVL